MAASTLCILSVVSRHIMYLITYFSNNYMFLRLCQIKIVLWLLNCSNLADNNPIRQIIIFIMTFSSVF